MMRADAKYNVPSLDAQYRDYGPADDRCAERDFRTDTDRRVDRHRQRLHVHRLARLELAGAGSACRRSRWRQQVAIHPGPRCGGRNDRSAHHRQRIAFPEGPVALSDGSVLVVEVERGRLTRVWPDGTLSVAAAAGPTAQRWARRQGLSVQQRGLAELARGRRAAAARPMPTPGAAAASSAWTSIAEQSEPSTRPLPVVRCAAPTTSCSTMPAGSGSPIIARCRAAAWTSRRFTTHGSTVRAARKSSSRWVQRANGIALSPDGSRLYVAETYAAHVWCWELSTARAA